MKKAKWREFLLDILALAGCLLFFFFVGIINALDAGTLEFLSGFWWLLLVIGAGVILWRVSLRVDWGLDKWDN